MMSCKVTRVDTADGQFDTKYFHSRKSYVLSYSDQRIVIYDVSTSLRDSIPYLLVYLNTFVCTYFVTYFFAMVNTPRLLSNENQ
jgi:hypothetical protein